jgi:hypothetical protein
VLGRRDVKPHNIADFDNKVRIRTSRSCAAVGRRHAKCVAQRRPRPQKP